MERQRDGDPAHDRLGHPRAAEFAAEAGAYREAYVAALLAICLAPLAVIDDAIRPNELHLLRLAPLAWLQPGAEGVYEHVPTVYGPVTLRTEVSKDGRTLDVTCRAEFRAAPEKVILHVPPMPGLRTMRLNGRKAAGKGGRVEVPLSSVEPRESER